jgi:rhamnose transport system ATP-binding protein
MSAEAGAVAPVLKASDIRKHFAGVDALRGVDLDLYAGEVHALVGENGAGKSTMVKILAGIHKPDAGAIRIDGELQEIANPEHSRTLGIAVVHQEPVLFPQLSVAENIYLENPPRTRFGNVDWRRMYAEAQDKLDGFGVPLSARRPVEGLSAAEQQLVELARALTFKAKVLVLDEATASLSSTEVERLFALVQSLKEQGVALMFVGHRLDEVFRVADRLTVLRDGALVRTAMAPEVTIDDVIRAMVGRQLDSLYPKVKGDIGETVLEATGLTRRGFFEDVSFDLRRGEILGFAGLVGAGRTEIARAIFGIDSLDAGTIRINGSAVVPRSPKQMMREGIALVPEDRHAQGVVLELPITPNITLPVLPELARGGMLDTGREERLAQEYAERLQVKASSLKQVVASLSGGNQQKVVLAKWLVTKPSIIILDDPTRGIDVGTKAEVHRLMSSLATEGVAIILISNELDEVRAMSDRLLVFSRGRLAARFDQPPFDEEQVMAAAVDARPEEVAS